MHATDQLDPNDLTQSSSGRATSPLAIRERPSAWRRLLRDSKAIAGGIILLILIAASVGAPLLTNYAPEKQDIRNKLQAPAWQAGGDSSHLLGTDQLGRDLLTRILYGGRVSLFIALVATLGASILGIAFGVLSGYFGSFTDTIIMRLVDVQMAFPSILLALAVMVMLGTGIRNLVIVLAITSWVFFSRVVRADVLTIRHRDYVEAGRAIGATHWRLIWYYIAPNLVGTITVVATLTVARTIISEASLSFLGLGIQPPTPSWGGMLADGRGYLSVAWWIGTFPGVALMATVIAVNLLGDALRDVLDPQIDASEN
ncbi:MAG TPA: ABC transporter permease [Nitrolancea sp.]